MKNYKEKWKHIKGYENLYEVSNLGRVRTIPREVIRSNGRPYTLVSKTLKPAKDVQGYLRYGLSKNKKLITEKAHRLVANTFLVPNVGCAEVNHIDGVKDNNSLDNLEWVTRSENIKHAFKLGLAKPMIGENNPTSKVSLEEVIEIKKRILTESKLKDISRDLNVSYYIVKDISRGKTWKHVRV